MFLLNPSIKFAILCVQLITLQLLFFVPSIDSAPAEEKICFAVQLHIPFDRTDQLTVAFEDSAYRQKQAPILRYIPPLMSRITATIKKGFLSVANSHRTEEDPLFAKTSTINTYGDIRDTANKMTTNFEFNPAESDHPGENAVGLHLIAELFQRKHKPEGSKKLTDTVREKLQSIVPEEFLAHTGGHFELEVFNENNDKWTIVLKPDQLKISDNQVSGGYQWSDKTVSIVKVTLKLLAVIEPQKYHKKNGLTGISHFLHSNIGGNDHQSHSSDQKQNNNHVNHIMLSEQAKEFLDQKQKH